MGEFDSTVYKRLSGSKTAVVMEVRKQITQFLSFYRIKHKEYWILKFRATVTFKIKGNVPSHL